MAEYRRRFFETLMKVIIFLFLLALILMLFYEIALPWFKASFAPQEPLSQENKPSVSRPVDHPLPPPTPSLNAESWEKTGASAKPTPAPSEEQDEINLAPTDLNPSATETPSTLRGKDFFIGCWRIYEGGRYASSITLQQDFTARDSRHPSIVGTWEYHRGEARVLWKDGWRVVLRCEDETVRKVSYSPDDPNEFRPANEGTATKVD
jgi:hypothetical protein